MLFYNNYYCSVISKRKATSNDSASIVRTGSEPIISSTLKSSSYLSLENSNDDKEQMVILNEC